MAATTAERMKLSSHGWQGSLLFARYQRHAGNAKPSTRIWAHAIEAQRLSKLDDLVQSSLLAVTNDRVGRPMERAFSLAWRGAKIGYRRLGSGPVLVFLRSEDSLPDDPGFVETLSKSFDLIIPDHPGFRSSDTPDWLKGMGDTAYFYLDFLEQLDLTDVHLVGSSLGGWIAAELAIRDTARIATISLIAPFGVRRRGTPFGDIFMWTAEENLENRRFDRALADKFLAAARNQSPEAATAYLKDRYAAARLCWHPRFHNPELERWLHRIDRPLHLIWGDDDKIVPLDVAESWREALPQARLRVIERCGHLPQVEHPRATAETIQSLIHEARA
jgi:pimeloyl-ACP methyl ester carboxylesterase